MLLRSTSAVVEGSGVEGSGMEGSGEVNFLLFDHLSHPPVLVQSFKNCVAGGRLWNSSPSLSDASIARRPRNAHRRQPSDGRFNDATDAFLDDRRRRNEHDQRPSPADQSRHRRVRRHEDNVVWSERALLGIQSGASERPLRTFKSGGRITGCSETGESRRTIIANWKSGQNVLLVVDAGALFRKYRTVFVSVFDEARDAIAMKKRQRNTYFHDYDKLFSLKNYLPYLS